MINTTSETYITVFFLKKDSFFMFWSKKRLRPKIKKKEEDKTKLTQAANFVRRIVRNLRVAIKVVSHLD